MTDCEVQLQRGHCFRCHQRWVLGYVDQSVGEYGQFYCAACNDEGPRKRRKSASESEDVEDGSESPDDAGQETQEEKTADEKHVPWPMKAAEKTLLDSSGIRVERVSVGGHMPDSPRRPLRMVFEVAFGDAKRFNSCGAAVWMGAKVLSSFLERRLGRGDLKGKRLVELGAGCGMPGMVAAQLGAQVVLTDVPELRPLLECNVAANFAPASFVDTAGIDAQDSMGSIGVAPAVASLDWESQDDLRNVLQHDGQQTCFDYVIGADIGYDPDVYRALLTTTYSLLTGCVHADDFEAQDDGEQEEGLNEEQLEALEAEKKEKENAKLELLKHVPPSHAPCQPQGRAILALAVRSGEFEDFCDCARESGWTVEILEKIDLEVERGDPLCSPVAVVSLTC